MTSGGDTKVTRTACTVGDGVGCGLLAHVKDGVLVKVEPADFETMFRATLKALG